MNFVNLNKPEYGSEKTPETPGFYEDSTGKVFLGLILPDKAFAFYDLEQFVQVIPSYPVKAVTVVEIQYK